MIQEVGFCFADGISLYFFSVLLTVQHSKSSQWCQEHFLNYKGLVRASVVREQLKKLLVRFKVPKKSSEGEHFFFTCCPILIEDSLQIVSLLAVFPLTFEVFSPWPKNNVNVN